MGAPEPASRILVTGAAGFVGGHLLDALVPSGASITACYRPGSDPGRHADRVTWSALELLDASAVHTLVARTRPDQIYHLAGAAHVAQSWHHTYETYQGNVLATHYLLEAVRKAGLTPRVLVTGSSTIYRPQDHALVETDPLQPGSPYATSKLAQEMLALAAHRDDGVPVLIARSFNHIGPRQDPSYVAAGIARQIARMERGEQDPVLTVGNLEPKRDLTDVRDTVRAYLAMMARGTPGLPYNVCSGRELSIRALVETFAARAKRPVQIVQDPSRFRPNDTPFVVGSAARLQADTGWQPTIAFEQTIDDLLDHWRGV